MFQPCSATRTRPRRITTTIKLRHLMPVADTAGSSIDTARWPETHDIQRLSQLSAIRKPKRETSMRAAIYARYSSDLQREASIEDQVRLCKERIEQEQWAICETYTDHAMSGASRHRPG